jgi:hypothetical protein
MRRILPTLIASLLRQVYEYKRLLSRFSPFWPAFLRGARRGLSLVDPRVVRLRDPVPLPRRLLTWAVAGSGLLVTIAVLTAGEGSASAGPGETSASSVSAPSTVEGEALPASVDPVTGAASSTSMQSSEENAALSAKAEARHLRFYDPLLIFTEHPPSSVCAYPLLAPAGIVVDIYGIPDPLLSSEQLVSRDERILAVKRRSTTSGVRYIISLSTPVRKINTEHEGNVVMVYPVE